MSRDVAIPDQAPARARPRPAANLTQRASLNVVASLLEKRQPSIHLFRRVPNVLKNVAKLVYVIRIRGN